MCRSLGIQQQRGTLSSAGCRKKAAAQMMKSKAMAMPERRTDTILYGRPINSSINETMLSRAP